MTPDEMRNRAQGLFKTGQHTGSNAITTRAVVWAVGAAIRQGQLDIEEKLDRVLGLLEGVEESEPAIPDPALGCLLCDRKDVFTMYCDSPVAGTLVPHCERCHKAHAPNYVMVCEDSLQFNIGLHAETCTTRSTMNPELRDCGTAPRTVRFPDREE